MTGPPLVLHHSLLASDPLNRALRPGMLADTTDMESRRLDLYNRLQEVLGANPATTLMTHLPPVSAEDLITNKEFADFKAEFAEFRTEVGKRFDQVDSKFDQVNERIDRVLLAVVGGLFVVVATFVGLTVL